MRPSASQSDRSEASQWCVGSAISSVWADASVGVSGKLDGAAPRRPYMAIGLAGGSGTGDKVARRVGGYTIPLRGYFSSLML